MILKQANFEAALVHLKEAYISLDGEWNEISKEQIKEAVIALCMDDESALEQANEIFFNVIE